MRNGYEIKVFDKKTIYLLLGLILLLGSSIFIVLKLKLGIFYGTNNAGEIGDAIGGISGPIINIFGAILVYKSFLVQLNANKIQVENFENDKVFRDLWDLYKEAKNDFENFQYISVLSNNSSIIFRGHHAFEKFLSEVQMAFTEVKDKRSFIIYEIISMLKGFLLTYQKINESYININDKELLKIKMNNILNKQYEEKLNQLQEIYSKQIEICKLPDEPVRELFKTLENIKKVRNL